MNSLIRRSRWTAVAAILLYAAWQPSAAGGEITGTVRTGERALSDAVVYIEKIEGRTFLPPQQPAVLDQVKLTFVPHVLPVLVGTTVSLPNSDVVLHNVFSPRKDKRFDLGTYRPDAARTILCDRPGITPILCRIHPEMSAFIVVVPTPYYAVTNEKGAYRIAGVPPGTYLLAAWHETTRVVTQDITVTERGAASAEFKLKR